MVTCMNTFILNVQGAKKYVYFAIEIFFYAKKHLQHIPDQPCIVFC